MPWQVSRIHQRRHQTERGLRPGYRPDLQPSALLPFWKDNGGSRPCRRVVEAADEARRHQRDQRCLQHLSCRNVYVEPAPCDRKPARFEGEGAWKRPNDVTVVDAGDLVAEERHPASDERSGKCGLAGPGSPRQHHNVVAPPDRRRMKQQTARVRRRTQGLRCRPPSTRHGAVPGDHHRPTRNEVSRSAAPPPRRSPIQPEGQHRRRAARRATDRSRA